MTSETSSDQTKDVFDDRGEKVVEVAEALRERKRELEEQRRAEELEQYKQDRLDELQQDDPHEDESDSTTQTDASEESEDPSYPPFLTGQALGIENVRYPRSTFGEETDTETETPTAIDLVVDTIELGELVFTVPVSDKPDSDHKFNRMLRYQGDTWDEFNPSQWKKPIYLKQTAVVEPDSGREIADHYEIEYPPRDSLGLRAFYRAYCWYNCQQTHTVVETEDNPRGERIPTPRGIVLLRAPLLAFTLIALHLVHDAVFTALLPTLLTFALVGFALWNTAILGYAVLFRNRRWLNTLSAFAS